MKTSPTNYNLRAIYVRSSTLAMAEDFDPTIGGQELLGQFRSNLSEFGIRTTSGRADDGAIQENRSFEFTTNCMFRYQTQKKDEKGKASMETVASISVDFVCSYEPNSKTEPSKEEIESFGKTAVLMHIWPYFREYCASSLQKMHLPVVSIPLMQIKFPSDATEKETPSKSKGGAMAGKSKKPSTTRTVSKKQSTSK